MPQVALVQTAQGRAVFVVNAEGMVESRLVTLGDAVGGSVAVLYGVKAGERVALDQVQKLRGGLKVVPVAR